ncbi:MAG TPA: peptidoglycan editing factor PgeF [Anaerolineales bacterium]|nr:peptidoglycan editing factor PgeF [Anaerolineales bacterium]
MAFHQPDDIRYFTFDSFSDGDITQAVFTRQGGISPHPWASLNVGGLRGDDPKRVYQNRVCSFELMDRIPESVYDVWQVHSTDVIWTTGSRPGSVRHRKADAILTDRPEVTLFLRFGDCVPILLHDPVKRVIGIAHAGWMGTVNGIVKETIVAMQNSYRSNPGDILAAIGPSIAVHHYEVGPEVEQMVDKSFGSSAKEFLIREEGKTYFDLWRANQYQLEEIGVNKIEVAGICTACNLDDWFSHRGEQGKTGRFGALIALRN